MLHYLESMRKTGFLASLTVYSLAKEESMAVLNGTYGSYVCLEFNNY